MLSSEACGIVVNKTDSSYQTARVSNPSHSVTY